MTSFTAIIHQFLVLNQKCHTPFSGIEQQIIRHRFYKQASWAVKKVAEKLEEIYIKKADVFEVFRRQMCACVPACEREFECACVIMCVCVCVLVCVCVRLRASVSAYVFVRAPVFACLRSHKVPTPLI